MADREIFRREAYVHHAAGRRAGAPLRISPRWTRSASAVLLAALLGSAGYALVGTVDEYAAGPAVVRVDGRTEITARVPGTVEELMIQPGQRVAAGEVLVRLDAADQRLDLERLDRDLEAQLVSVLRSPGDEAARRSIAGLRPQRELAQARLTERSIHAPAAGVVSDVRIRPGQRLEPGEPILSLVSDVARFQVIVLLPGHYRPMLRRGMPLRMELVGYRYAYHDLVVDEVGDEVVGPGEIRRFLGPELSDAVLIAGPTVLVRAHLPSDSFVVDGSRFRFFDGMQGSAEARVRSERIAVALVPALRWALGG